MPSTTTRPELRVSSPPRILMSVVFPEPEGPMRATHSAAWTSKLRSSIARNDPYFLTRFSIATCGAAVFVPAESGRERSRFTSKNRGRAHAGETPQRVRAENRNDES